MKKILLDTNFLLIPGQFMIDIFTGIEKIMNEPYVLVVLDKTMNELEKFGQGKSKDARAAQLAIALVMARKANSPTLWDRLFGLKPSEQAKLQIVKAGIGYVDDAIVKLGDKETIVATQDKILKQRLRKKKIPTITMKGKKKIGFG
ncbi:hypothetical protein GOV10_06970 [Candidatus Woesearchaeota archaeon]|nr:hypothetical protein [Candidatus Woesearchaeota archaeon]